MAGLPYWAPVLAVLRSSNGRRISVAGWGPEVSDEAGGQRMGREALRRTLWAYDGRAEKSGLTAAILTRFNWDPARNCIFCRKSQLS